MRPAEPRLPLAPLERRVCAHLDRAGAHSRHGDTSDPNLASADELGAAVGVTGRTWTRWRETGIRITQADRAAVAVGDHPLDIWGDDFHQGTT